MARRYVEHIAPFIDVDFWVTQEFGAPTSGGGTHKGIDIATIGSRPIYSISKGNVYYKGYQANGYGYYIIIKNSDDDKGFLYAHLMSESTLALGESVQVGEFIGNEGSSGNSTGIHLHLEHQTMTGGTWHYSSNLSDYLNPADYMGIANMVDPNNSWYYDGTPVPPEPKKKHSFPWFIFSSDTSILGEDLEVDE